MRILRVRPRITLHAAPSHFLEEGDADGCALCYLALGDVTESGTPPSRSYTEGDHNIRAVRRHSSPGKTEEGENQTCGRVTEEQP